MPDKSNRTKTTMVEVLSLLGATAASVALGLSGQYVEAGGLLAAAMSSLSFVKSGA